MSMGITAYMIICRYIHIVFKYTDLFLVTDYCFGDKTSEISINEVRSIPYTDITVYQLQVLLEGGLLIEITVTPIFVGLFIK